MDKSKINDWVEDCRKNMIDFLIENGYDETVIYENPGYETAFVGVSDDGRAIYDFDKMVEYLIKVDNMTEEEAIEWIDYNTLRAYTEGQPIVMTSMAAWFI